MTRFKTFASLLFFLLFVKTATAQLTVNVPAGGDVAGAALQVLQAGGGTINLAAGNYYITGSIVLGANTTLNGAGGPGSTTQSVIYAPASPNGIAMVTQAYAGAPNLTLSNLVLDGNIPQAAMLYGTGNGNYAYNDTGIYFYDQSATTVGVTLTNIEVRHTLRGILTGLVDNLTISGCYFHDNNPGGFSHNMYLVATSGVEIDHTRSNNALTGDGLHIDFGGYFYTIRKSEFSGNNGLGILSQQDNSVTVEDSKIDFNTNDGIQIDAGGLLLTRDQMNHNGGYGFNIPDTADGNGQVNGVYTLGDGATDYFYQASINDFTIYGPPANVYPAIQATGVTGVVDTADWTLNYPGYTYMGAVDFNANHLTDGSITFPYVGATVEGTPGSGVGSYPLVFRYSNGTSSAQTMNVSVNGGAPVALSFPPTGSYSTWNTVTMNVVLNVGNSTVTMSVPAAATSAPEIDTLTVTTPTPNAPNAPTNLTGTSTGPYSITLNWTAPSAGNNNAAQTYMVYRNGGLIAINVVGTSYTDTRIFYGESTYSYFVVAVNQGGDSGGSNTVTVTSGIDAPPGLQVGVSPGVPANNLNWLGVSGAANYLVRRSTVSGGPYQTVATLAATTGFPSYSDTSLAVGTNYFYVVAAVDASGNVSANSYQVEALSETFSLSASAPSVNLSSASPDIISVVGTNGFSDAVSFAVSGLPAGVAASLSATSGSATQITFTANTSATQGSYPVTITGTDGNLTSSVGVTVVIGSGQLAQVITFNPIPQQAVGNSLAVYATASSGLPVTFSVVPNGNCSVTGNVVTFLNGGACGVLANQAGNSTFSAAAQVGQLVQVGAPTAQTITFATIPTQVPGISIALIATASSGLAVSFASTTPGVCIVSGSTATLLNGGICTVVASQAGGGVYGPAQSVSQSFSVGQPQTITFLPPAAVTYGVAPIALSATATSGLAVSYSVSSGPGTLSGSSLTVTGAGTIVIVASQSGSSAFSAATPVTANIVVTPAILTVTANNLSRVVGAANPAFTYTPTGFVNGDTNAIVSGTPSFTTTATATSAVGSYPITITQGTLSAGINYTLVFVNGTLQITAGGATTTTLAAVPVSATYGQTVTLNAKVLDGSSSPVTGGSVSYSLYNAATNSATTFGSAPVNTTTGIASLSTTALPAGADTVLAVYIPAANYSASGNSVVVNISAAPITITVNAASKVYGAAVPTLSGTIGTAQNGDVLSANYTTTATAASPVGNYPITATLTGSAAANYNVAVVPAVLSVTPATLTVTANSFSRPANTANPTLTYSVTGYVNGDTSAILSGAPVLSTTATTSSSVGPYAISIAQGTLSAGANYTLVLVPGTLTVTQVASQTITFAPPSVVTYGVAPIALNATASSGLAVSYSVSSGPGTLSGSTLTVTGAGTIVVVASQSGNSTYPAATPVTANIVVNPASLVVTANNLSRAANTANPTLSYTVTGYVNVDTTAILSGAPVLSTTATTSSPAGPYAISIAQGTLSAGANYTLVLTPGTLTVTQAASQTITFAPPSLVTYGVAPITLSAMASSGLAASYSVSSGPGTLSGSTLTVTGAGTIVVVASQSGNSTYPAATPVTANIVVNPASLSVAANSVSRAAGTANPTLTYTVTGYVNGDTAAILSGAPLLSTTATTSSPAGPYAISIAQGTLSAGANYTLVLTPGTLTVTPASSQTIAFATIPNTVYGAAPFTLTATASSGLPVTISVVQGNVALSGATSALIGGTVTVLGAGPVTLQASQAGNATYPAATPVQQSFSIAPASLTATANAVSYVYGTSPPALNGSLSATVGTDSFTESYTTNAPAVSPVPAGSYTITPVLAAVAPTVAANYSIAYNTAKMTVTQAGTTTTLGPLPGTVVQGTTVQLTATVLSTTSGTPTQTVNFYAGTTFLGAMPLNGGVATLPTSSLPGGSQNVYAVYGGDGNFIGSQSASQTTSVVVAPGFSVTSASPTLSIVAGQTGTMVISVASVGGYAKTVTASCGGGLPGGVTCGFSPTSLTFTGQNNTLTTTLSVATSLFASTDTHRDGTAMAGVFWMAGLLGLWGISRRKLRKRVPGLICLLVLVGLAGLSGCGSTHTVTATPGSYSVPVTVSDGTTAASVTVTVIIH
jgi:hypothetical protein